jgi:DnaK suppressor protein
MAPKDDRQSGQRPAMVEHKRIEVRGRLEEALLAAREKAAQLDKRLHVRGDYGYGRGDPIVVDWEFNLALRKRMDKEIEQLDVALRRINEGTYGECQACGGAINPERQKALPQSTLCVACARSGQTETVP